GHRESTSGNTASTAPARPASPRARTGASGPDRAGSPSRRPDRVLVRCSPRPLTTAAPPEPVRKRTTTVVSCFPPKDRSVALLEAAVVESQATERRSGPPEP